MSGIVAAMGLMMILGQIALLVFGTHARGVPSIFPGILDISGVSVIDTAVANHFIKMTKAATLMGCRCIISGISPIIAQTIALTELG